MLDALLHGRGWLALIFALLVGIVFFNVDLLQLNRDIAQMSERASELKRENSLRRAEVARLGSSERIQQVAAEFGLVLPAPGEVRYLRAHSNDGERAAQRLAAGPPETAPVEVPESTPQAIPPAATPVDAPAATPAATDPVSGAPVEPAAPNPEPAAATGAPTP